ncbi:LuxR C-terminal-related transcriptional regulator [Brevibacillus fluminis]|uniref:LuxR C-terminal-related transcriptional regulator n=1 Tax=Brevibacillus fluminis TaxID=511487 RepID=UPI003F8B658B
MCALSLADYRNVQRFIAEITATAEFSRDRVLHSLSTIFGYHKCVFWKVDESGRLNQPAALNIDHRAIELYLLHFRQRDILSPNRIPHRCSHHKVLRTKDVIARKDYEKTEYYKCLMQPFEMYHELGVYLTDGNKTVGVIGLTRSKGEKDFSALDILRLETISRYISSAFVQHSLHAEIVHKQKLLASFVDRSTHGIVFFDTSFHIHYANPAATQLSEEWLASTTEKGGDSVGRFIQCVVQGMDWECGIEKTIELPCNRALSLQIAPYIGMEANALHPNLYIAQMKPHFLKPKWTEEMVEAKSLTQKEREVLACVSKGLTNPEIANELFISVNTVKRHLQSIYRKIGVTNRTQLCYQLKSYTTT